MTDSPAVRLHGRSSSHFTRVAAIIAHELDVPCELVVVHDLRNLDPDRYGGHPGLKLPTLHVGAAVVFGTENICRRLAALAGATGRIVWPEQVTADVARNAQELTWHAMATQVQLIVATVLGDVPADSVLVTKGRGGLAGTLAWLDAHLALTLEALPRTRALSLLEVTLFCLVEHLAFSPTVPLLPYPRLCAFAAAFAARPSAAHTAFRFDAPLPGPTETPCR